MELDLCNACNTCSSIRVNNCLQVLAAYMSAGEIEKMGSTALGSSCDCPIVYIIGVPIHVQ